LRTTEALVRPDAHDRTSCLGSDYNHNNTPELGESSDMWGQGQ
jgi:hypothetical protein